MMQVTVADSFSIANRGAAVLLEPGHVPLALGSEHRVLIARPDGCSVEANAVVENTGKVPPGEVMALLFQNLAPEDVPPGSLLTVLDK